MQSMVFGGSLVMVIAPERGQVGATLLIIENRATARKSSDCSQVEILFDSSIAYVASRTTTKVAQEASTQEKPINIRRGESGGEQKGGPLWSPAGWGGGRVSPTYQPEEQDAGDPKGPPIRTNLREMTKQGLI